MKAPSCGRGSEALSIDTDSIKIFSINSSTGALTSVGSQSTGADPFSFGFHPNGNFLFVSCFSSDEVRVYSVNQTDGTLTFVEAQTGMDAPNGMNVATTLVIPE